MTCRQIVARVRRLSRSLPVCLAVVAWGARAAPPQADPAIHAMLPDSIRQSGEFRIATDAHHPPCESFADDNTTMIGIEPDLWNAIAARMGLKAMPVSIDFAGLIPGVQAGRYDAAFECMSDSADREREVAFIDYAHAGLAGYALADDPTAPSSVKDLCGLHGGVQIGTDFAAGLQSLSQACTSRGKPAIETSQYPSAANVILALYSGRVNFILDDRGAYQHIKTFSTRPIRTFDAGFPLKIDGVAVARDNTKLQAALLATLRSLHADGTYGAIYRKWGIEPLQLARPGLDLATHG